MAHNLTTTNGKTEMAYVGDTPWHGLGTRLDAVATATEMLLAAGLNWDVEKVEIVTADGDAIPSHRAIRRVDTRTTLGIVGKGYKAIQNAQVFQIGDDLAGTAGALYHTAGSLKGGKKCWALLKLPTSITVGPDDTVDQYLLLAWGHDGLLALTIRFTPIRVVCWNTLGAALEMNLETGRQKRTADAVYIHHTENAEVRIDEIKQTLGIATKFFEQAGQSYQAMSAVQLTQATLATYLEAVVPLTMPSLRPTTAELEAAASRQRETHEAIVRCFETGRGSDLATASGTLWGAYNAVTEYVDHVHPVLKDGTISAARQEAAVFGTGSELKRRAYSQAVALL